MAISDNTAIVGAIGNDDTGSKSSSAYLFDVSTGEQRFKLTADDATEDDRFGWSVAISGNTAIVGVWRDDHAGEDSGSAYLFDVNTGQQRFKLTADDASGGDRFGESVAISGNTAIVGARGGDDAGEDSGSAYLFNVSTGQQIAKLSANDTAEGDAFGSAVAINGDTAIVGAGGDDDAGSNSGSAYLFDVSSGNPIAKLTASDAARGDWFGNGLGSTVAINGNTAIVGANGNDDAGGASGSAYIFSTPPDVQLGFDFAIDPATADNVIDASTGTGARTGLSLTGPGTIGILNHPGAPDGNLVMWFVLDGLSSSELDDLAAELGTQDDVLSAEQILPGSGPSFLPDANLMFTLDEGAFPGESAAIEYNFGAGVTMTAFAVPEPSGFVLAALALAGCVFRWRRRHRVYSTVPRP